MDQMEYYPKDEIIANKKYLFTCSNSYVVPYVNLQLERLEFNINENNNGDPPEINYL